MKNVYLKTLPLLITSICMSGSVFAQDMASPPNSLVVIDSGYVGVGTATPSAKLSVIGDSATETDVQIFVENLNTVTPGPLKLFQLKNNGNVKFSMIPSATDEWAFNATPTEFRVSKQLSGNIEMLVTDTGNMTITGTLTQGSSRDIKHDIVNVDSQEVLDKVLALPISTWSYNNDKGVTHLGPMAEDFYQAFSLGATDKGIASIDTGGVALAAIKGLNEIVKSKDQEIDVLRSELAELKELVYALAAKDKVAMNQ